MKTSEGYPVKFANEELKKRLSPQQYYVTQNQGTERLVVKCALVCGVQL